MSAHFSNNESYPEMSDRAHTNSARSTADNLLEQLKLQLALQKRQNVELQNKYQELNQEHLKIKGREKVLEEENKGLREENQKIKEELGERKERQKTAKGKLKQWVSAAKQNLNQV